MYQSRVLSVAIARPVGEVYAFLAEPRNLTRWVAAFGEDFVQLRAHEWEAVSEGRRLVLRFTPRNGFGVLDFSVSPPGRELPMRPVRVHANGKGAEVAITLFRLPGMSAERFESDCAWTEADLGVLKAFLEGV